MSFQDVVARINAIESMVQLLTPAAAPPPAPAAAATGSGATFDQVLGNAISSSTPTSTSAPASSAPDPSTGAVAGSSDATGPVAVPPTPTDVGAKVLEVAQGEIGQAEQPPGSNDSPRIATYRSAVRGAIAGEPWCAYFVSWAAAQAGYPLGENGQGYGSVSEITSWASRTGRLLPASATPRPGDLILFGTHHVGIVESVASDGTITTVEGNTGDAVRRRQRQPGEATGFVRL